VDTATAAAARPASTTAATITIRRMPAGRLSPATSRATPASGGSASFATAIVVVVTTV
jgi:hypothetical protein